MQAYVKRIGIAGNLGAAETQEPVELVGRKT
jgi:hypothetical protein